MKNKKKAFTLTELLVVVIVIGILSAAVLPKFSKIIETRKTTEAEELMASIRTEQEKRCALDKPYLTNMAEMTDIVKKSNTKNYSLTLAEKGISAASKGNYSYNLQIPSYADGRICCEGADCAKLNKNYPACGELIARADYTPSPESCAGAAASAEPEEPGIQTCEGAASEPCGCLQKGTRTRTCNTATGEWNAWGACSVSAECACTGEKKTAQACRDSATCGFEIRAAMCNTSTGQWEYGVWDKSGCAAKPSAESVYCSSCGGTQSVSYACNTASGTWEQTLGECDKPEEKCLSLGEGERVEISDGTAKCKSTGQACTAAGWPGTWVTDAHGYCCCHADCFKNPVNGLTCKAPACVLTLTDDVGPLR